MKGLTLILNSVLLLVVEAYVIQTPTSSVDTITVPIGWVDVQKLLLPLFENVCEESAEPIIVRLNEEFKLDPTNGIYLKNDVIDNLQNLRASKGLLPKGEIFTESNLDHLNELKIIFEVLNYAKDFDTFYKAACWARQSVNCGLFVDAIYLAIINRKDTEKITLPAPYELLPNYFVRKDFIIKASSLIRGDTIDLNSYIRNIGNSYILDVNYTTNYNNDGGDKLTYFHEDIGLNSFYYFLKLKNSFWLTKNNSNGEFLYHMYKQMMARYNLERYSNGLPELEGIDWDYIDDLHSYDPMLIYSNGKAFSITSASTDNDVLTQIKYIESNVPSVVIHMRDAGYNKTEIINNLMDILVTRDNSYEKLALRFLNGDRSITSEPSVLEHFMTTARDPVFWKLNKNIVDIIDNALQILPSYTRNQLYFPGVEVQNIEVKKMMTTFDNFQFDVTNALKTEAEETKFQIKINQPRLSTKPFAFKINVSSFVAQKAIIKLYIGPKVMPGQLFEKKKMLMLLDCFEHNLKTGTNVITRASTDMMKLSDDLVSFETIQKKILDAEFGIETLPLKSVWSQIQFPSRLILPKGTPEGLPLNVFVYIAPYIKPSLSGSRSVEMINDAIFSPGYPLDLDIEIQQLFNLPNALVKDIILTHKTESTTNGKPSNTYSSGTGSRTWQSNDIDYETQNGLLHQADRPDFTKKTFDYKAKKNSYDKKYDYAAKKNENKYKKYKTIDIVTKDEAITEINNTDGKEPDNVEVINNIFISPDLDPDFTTDLKENTKNVFYKIPLDKDYNNYLVNPSDKNINEDFDENILRDTSYTKPNGLLKMPKQGFSNIFNIIFKPVTPDSSEEKVLE